MHEIATNRVIVIGAGLGALYAALKLAPRPVLMISPDILGEGASSAWAQGGIAAAMDPSDSAECHTRDTLRCGAGTVDRDVAASVTFEARAHVLDLTQLGTPFDRTADGGYALSREAAHSFARVVRVKGDQSGAEIMRALIAQVRATPSIQALEGVAAVGLEMSQGRVMGVEAELSRPERSPPVTIRGAAYLLAGGGAGGLFAHTTNPPRIRGEAVGMAARAGAAIADAEFVQFHPTAIDCGEDPAPLATEALRGEGAVLIDGSGNRFMLDRHPDAELAPRDIVARAVYAQTQAGLRPMLDTRAALGDRLPTEYPAVWSACARAGIDPSRQPIPVTAAAHYHIGGIETDRGGRASLDNLWVCGEASCTGLHGANRLASNGLLEALVYARRCAEGITAALGDSVAEASDVVVLPDLPAGEAPDPLLVNELRNAMTDWVGVVRHAQGLKQALRRTAGIEAAQPTCASLRNMTACATLIAAAALNREESRGAHFRSDFPPTSDAARRSRLTLSQAMAVRTRMEAENP